jgi:hypothetical protein
MIRVRLPVHLQRREVQIDVTGAITPSSILDALEARYPVLRGTVRDQLTHKRRDFIRFFACGDDYSLADPDLPLPEAIAQGSECFMIVGAMAGG